MLEIIKGTKIIRALRIVLGKGLDVSQDADGIDQVYVGGDQIFQGVTVMGGDPGTVLGSWVPMIAKYHLEDTSAGAFILHTQIPRAQNTMFKIRVHGYLYGISRIVDFTVVGYDIGQGLLGNIDGLAGTIIAFDLIDNGDDYLPKWVGIDANGKVAIALGNTGSAVYFPRLAADAQLTHSAIEANLQGWFFDTSAAANFGWGDIRQLVRRMVAPVGADLWTP